MAMESGRRKACEKAGVAVEDKLRETMVSILRARGPSKTWSVHEKKKKKNSRRSHSHAQRCSPLADGR